MTIMQNALHSFGGDWSWVPPKAATIAPADILEPSIAAFGWMACAARNKYELAALHRPPSGALLSQQVCAGLDLANMPHGLHDLGPVANNVEIDMS